MKEFKRKFRLFSVDLTVRFICDRCGATCDISTPKKEKYSTITVYPYWIYNDKKFELCPNCTKELLDFFLKADKDDLCKYKKHLDLFLD